MSSSSSFTWDHQRDWFVEDNGTFLLHPSTATPDAAPIPRRRSSLSRTMSRSSTLSISTVTSVNTVSTDVPIVGVLDLSLAEVCHYIDTYGSLQTAEIVSTECYSARAGAVTHRFVVLELRRPRRKNVWLRLDRRRERGVSLFKFLAAAGVTEANDRVRIRGS